MTVTGLVRRAYDVYVYADGDNRTYDRPRSVHHQQRRHRRDDDPINRPTREHEFFRTMFRSASDSKGNYVKFTITRPTSR